jgi:hypothetical protein
MTEKFNLLLKPNLEYFLLLKKQYHCHKFVGAKVNRKHEILDIGLLYKMENVGLQLDPCTFPLQ